MTGRRLGAVAAVLLGLLVVAFAAATDGPRPFSVSTDVPTLTGSVHTSSAPPLTSTASGAGSDVLVWIFSAAAVLVAIAAVGFAVSVLLRTNTRLGRLIRGGRHTGSAPATGRVVPAAELAAVVDRGMRHLGRGQVSDAIIACWLGVEDAAMEAGLELRQEETPSEFTERVVASYGESATPLRELAELYREARFSDHPLPESARRQAAECLQAVRDGLHAHQ